MIPSDLDLPTLTAIDAVFERLLIDIVQGTYPQGARLPAERELSRLLGASRPTLREALRRLGAWNLVEPRRGSGVVVKPYRDWSIEVVAAYIRHGKPQPGQPSIARILVDILTLRRALLVEVLRQSAGRIPPGSTEAARSAMARAWSNRADPSRYAQDDFDVMRLIVECAQYTPGLWVLNRISTIWLEFVEALKMLMRLPADYIETYTQFFDLIDAGQSEAAAKVIEAYLLRHDAELAAAAGATQANALQAGAPPAAAPQG
jgi:GntR family transcriptional regulator, transcriptional repressor for pyruvate dehydrogenase complex